MTIFGRVMLAVGLAVFLPGCGGDGSIKNQDSFERYISGHQYGSTPDRWIEMKSAVSEHWDRVGVIFGYEDDQAECEKAIAGLKRVNYARTYRCTPAQAGQAN